MARTTQAPTVGDRFKDLFFDTARYKLIDVESDVDDNNVPDNVDVRKGRADDVSQNSLGIPALASASGWLPVLGLFGLGVLVYKLVR